MKATGIFFILLFINITWIKAQKVMKGAIIYGELDSALQCDSVRLIVDADKYFNFSPFPIEPLRVFTVPVDDGKFIFKLPESLDYPVHFNIDSNMQHSMAKGDAYLSDYLLDRGDSINIKIAEEGLNFSGNGVEKYNCKYALDLAEHSERSLELGRGQTITNGLLYDFHYKDSVINSTTYAVINYERLLQTRDRVLRIMLAEFNKHRHLLPDRIFQLIYVDLVMSWKNRLFSSFSSDIKLVKDYSKLDYLKQLFSKLPAPEETIPEHILLKSPYYLTYLWQKELREFYFSHQYFNNSEMYYQIKGKYPEKTNEQFLTYYINLVDRRLPDNTTLITDALNGQVKSISYRNVLENLLTKGKTRTLAYDFALPDLKGDTVRLSDFKGKVVFLDFYFRGCAPCRLYYQHIVSKAKQIYKENSNVVFVAISIDKTRGDWIKGVESEEYSSSQAININTEGMGSDHDVIRNYVVRGYPTPILIDKRGYIFNRMHEHLRVSVENLKEQIDLALAAN